jgi:UPF0271 protein
MDVTPQEVYDLVVYQIGALLGFALAAGATLHHVKPHGALYNMAAGKAELADAIAAAVRDVDGRLVLYALAGSHLVTAGERAGLRTASEVFADRHYMPDGSLVSRRRPDAMVATADEAVSLALRMVRDGRTRAVDGSEIALRAETICIHGDSPRAPEFARRLHAALKEAGIIVQAIS